MTTKERFLSEIKDKEELELSLMVMRVIFKDNNKVVCILADKTSEIKANITCKDDKINPGVVLKIIGIKNINLDVKKYEFVTEYKIEDYLPVVKRNIDEIMDDIDKLTTKYVISREGKELNNYFFCDKEFLDKFKKGIGGVSMHHNYIGGLAEHTLNVMDLTAMLSEKYDCRRKEITVLSAKLHDIGKIYEVYYEGPFKYTLRGELEGHIVIGVQMIDEAVKNKPDFYNDDFVDRIKGCIVQHHGKLEYGSPREMNMEEAFILNYADSIDATMNKITQMKEKTESNTWSEYDRRLETKLYL